MAEARKAKPSAGKVTAASLSHSRSGAAAARSPRPLCEVGAGQSVEVVEQELAGEEASLLGALGIVAGSRLIVRANGDPCIVEVRAARVGIARRVAAKVIVRSTAHPRP